MNRIMVLNGVQLKKLLRFPGCKDVILVTSIMDQIRDNAPGRYEPEEEERIARTAEMIIEKGWLYDEIYESEHEYLNLCLVALAWLLPDLWPITGEIPVEYLYDIIYALSECEAGERVKRLWSALAGGRWLTVDDDFCLNPEELTSQPYYGFLTMDELDYFINATRDILPDIQETLGTKHAEIIEDILYACKEALFEKKDVLSIVS